MQRQITRGASANAGLIFHVFAQDSTSTTGAGKASVGFGSWSCRYIRNGEAISGAITPEDITTIGTYAAPTANTNIRIKAVDNTNMIGVYEVQIHADWVNTTNNCQSLTIYLTASGVAVLPIQIPLIATNVQDAVRGGMTALPNANAEAAGGLYTRGSGAGQINQAANGQIDVRGVAMATGVIDAAAIAADAIGASEFAQAAADKVWSSAARTLTSLGASLVQEIWDRATSALTTVGSIGKLIVDNLNATISSRAAQTTADAIEIDTQDIQSRLPAALVSGRMDSSVGAMAANTLTASALATDAVAEVADQVWDEAISGHLGAGSTGAALNAAGSAGDPWSTPIPGAYGAGTAGKIVGDNLNATVGSRASQTTADAIETDTQDIQTRLPAALVSGRMDASVGAMASGVVTAAAIATGAVDADAVAADAVSELQSGLATAAALSSLQSDATAIKAKTDNLPVRIRKNTALANFEFEMVVASDHVSAATGLTVTAQRSIDGAAYGACANSVSEVGSGTYKINLAAGDLNGDVITLMFSAATADTRKITIVTQV